jgi:small-conductance mechanosensitive channel
VLPGFYADWAQPTFNILRVLIYAFTVAICYPHLPGSGSATFQGISVFVGIIVSLGSTSAISNLVAGIVLTYTRSFKIGDLIKLNDVTGFVVEKSGIVIRLRTTKNEYVTFPNMTVLTSSVTNYHTSIDNEESLIVHAEITEGYDTPWKQVHEILIEAALKCGYILKEPKPYVLQKALDDFFCRYEINAYTKEVNKLSKVYSELYQNIQDGYAVAGLDMTTPYFWSNNK